MFHLHRLDDGNPLAFRDVCAGSNKDRQDLAVHWGLHGAIAIEMIDIDRVVGFQRDVALHALADRDDAARDRQDAHAARGPHAIHAHVRPVSPRDTCRARMALDHDAEIELAWRPERETIGGTPGVAPQGLGFPAGVWRKQGLDRGGDDARFDLRLNVREISQITIDKACVEMPGLKLRMTRKPTQKTRIAAWPDHHRFTKRCCEPTQRLRSIAAMRDYLGDHWIVVGRGHRTRFDTGVDA